MNAFQIALHGTIPLPYHHPWRDVVEKWRKKVSFVVDKIVEYPDRVRGLHIPAQEKVAREDVIREMGRMKLVRAFNIVRDIG